MGHRPTAQGQSQVAAEQLAYGQSPGLRRDDAGCWVRERLGRIYSESGSTHQGVATATGQWITSRRCSTTTGPMGARSFLWPGGRRRAGGNAGVALLLQAAGCETVELIDRFRSWPQR
jgi:hypothetical protein